MPNNVQSATNLPLSPIEDRKIRQRKYVIAMSIRTLCFILAIFVPGIGHAIFGVAALILPYFAVVVANAGADQNRVKHISPVMAQRRELETAKN